MQSVLDKYSPYLRVRHNVDNKSIIQSLYGCPPSDLKCKVNSIFKVPLVGDFNAAIVRDVLQAQAHAQAPVRQALLEYLDPSEPVFDDMIRDLTACTVNRIIYKLKAYIDFDSEDQALDMATSIRRAREGGLITTVPVPTPAQRSPTQGAPPAAHITDTITEVMSIIDDAVLDKIQDGPYLELCDKLLKIREWCQQHH